MPALTLPEGRRKVRSFFSLGRVARRVCAAALLAPGLAAAEDTAWADARVTAIAQFFQQALVPGQPGAVTQVEPALPFTVTGFSRVGGVGFAGGTVSGELSAWGRVGPRDALLGDGDVTAAWVGLQRGVFRARLGRQVTLPGASRYVRFDGASAGVTLGRVELDAYAGWVALPRWSLPRGAVLAGFAGDALKDLQLVEQQNRLGQIAAGARAGLSFGEYGRGAVAFHEQRDGVGLAFRVISADASGQPARGVFIGGRVTVDLSALQVPEARVYADVTRGRLPFSVDYSYQNPSLLLPKTSVLAAFGGAAWHELAGETSLQLPVFLKVTARAGAQLFEGNQPGGRGSLKATWTPGLDGRLLVLAEVGRALVPPAGFTWVRAGARYRAMTSLWASADASVWLYDVPVRGQTSSVTGIGGLEWVATRHVRTAASVTLMSTPYAAFEAQGLLRVIVELVPPSAGGPL